MKHFSPVRLAKSLSLGASVSDHNVGKQCAYTLYWKCTLKGQFEVTSDAITLLDISPEEILTHGHMVCIPENTFACRRKRMKTVWHHFIVYPQHTECVAK